MACVFRRLTKNPNLAPQGVYQAKYDSQKCALATAVGTHNTQEIPFLNREGDIFQYQIPIIGKIDVGRGSSLLLTLNHFWKEEINMNDTDMQIQWQEGSLGKSAVGEKQSSIHHGKA